MKPTERVAVVTGGSRGIGAAICRRLAGDELSVHLIFRDADDAAKQVVHEIESAGGSAVAHRADVADENRVGALVEDILTHSGGIHVLVNNAGIIDDRLLALTTLTQWQRVLQGDFNRSWRHNASQ